MIYIAHRGLMDGPSKELENRPDQIKKALNLGYDCEIDVRYIEGEWFLGHDNPDYPIDFNFLQQDRLWLHAKNLDALYILTAFNRLNYFWHQEDDFTLTSQGYIWTYPGKPLTKDSVCVMPEWNSNILEFNEDCYGVCSDFVGQMKK